MSNQMPASPPDADVAPKQPLDPLAIHQLPRYTVIVRLPFPRNGFEDPLPVDWNTEKDRELWKIISTAPNANNLNWADISSRLDVPLPFLLQQAAWLYEQHFEGMKLQMQRLGGGAEFPSGSGISGNTAGAASMQKIESGDHRASIAAVNRPGTSPVISTEAGSVAAGTKVARHTISRTPSTTTITQSRIQRNDVSGPSHVPLQRALRVSSGSGRQPPVLKPEFEQPRDDGAENAIDLGQQSSSESDDDRKPISQSQVYRRGPFIRKNRAPRLPALHADTDADDDGDGIAAEDDDDDDDDDDMGGNYLPFAAAGAPPRLKNDSDLAATLRSSPRLQPTIRQRPKFVHTSSKSSEFTTTESSVSSASSVAQNLTASSQEAPQRLAAALSPHHRAQLASLSPRASEGSPSMGSSFSDLDDTSITQSALDEAVMSNLRNGRLSSITSRMGSIRDVLSRRADGSS